MKKQKIAEVAIGEAEVVLSSCRDTCLDGIRHFGAQLVAQLPELFVFRSACTDA